MKLKRMVAIMSTVAAVMSMNTVAFADNEGYTDVEIATEAALMDVTVPSKLPIVFNEDGTNTIPSNFTITNNSSVATIHLDQVALDSEGSGWELLPENVDMSSQEANKRWIKFFVNSKCVSPSLYEAMDTGYAEFTEDEVVMGPGQSAKLNFEIHRGAFTQSFESSKAFTMVTSFGFN